MSRKGLVVAIGVVVAVNAVTLAMIAMNRSGQVDASVQVTERELRLPAAGMEDTGIALALAWQRPTDVSENEMPQFEWFDRPKLQSVGFDCRVAPDGPDAERSYAFPQMLPREVYAVLEYRDPARMPPDEGEPAADQETKKADEAPPTSARRVEPLSEVDRTRLSRLVPVDVGTDPAALRKRYSDRTRFIVAPAIAELRLIQARNGARARLAGRVTAVLPSDLYVAKPYRALLDKLQAADKGSGGPWLRMGHDPRYRVTLKYGSRFEPWIDKVEAISSSPPTR
jgi:hypothetical protein